MSAHRKKIGIYFTHSECLGHTSRVMAVGEVFKKRFPQGSLFFIQAGIVQPKARIDQMGKVYSLPNAFMDRRNFRGPIQGAHVHAEERGRICTDIVAREKPDVFITELFPLSREECRYELSSSLIKAVGQGSELWSVAGYPLFAVGKDSAWCEKTVKLYEKIMIFSPPLEKEFIANAFPLRRYRQRYLDFFESHAPKIKFAGYLLPRQEVVLKDEYENIAKPPIPRGACRVAVIRGAGAYYPKMIAEAILASDLLGKDYYLTVLAGPSTTPQEWDLFNKLARKKKVNNLALLMSTADYEGLIKKSDVCFSTASYHTSVMLLKHNKKAVLIPFEGYGLMSFHEQPARAMMLKEIMGAQILSIQDLTAKRLATALKNTAARPKINPSIPKGWFGGAAVLDKALAGILGVDSAAKWIYHMEKDNSSWS